MRIPTEPWAIFGAIVITVFLPTVLCWIRSDGTLDPRSLTIMMVMSGLLCSPGTFILSKIILPVLRLSSAIENEDEAPIMRKGALIGAILGFFNVPGYFAYAILENTPHPELRLIALFAITGATCGAWLGWQVYRGHHGKKSWLPRFNLSTLILLVMGWGVLLALFMPAEIPRHHLP